MNPTLKTTWPSVALVLLSAVLLVTAIALALGTTPAMLWLGLGLSALPAPGFLMLQRHTPPARKQEHPVLVSVLIGFGCVITMIGIQRFGEDHRWIAILSLLALVAWMLYQRFYWRTIRAATANSSNESG